MDNLRLSAVADRVVAWHNRHPLARRITAAQVHAIGYVALPFTAEAPPPASTSAAQAAAQAIAAAAALPLPVLNEVAQAAAAETQNPAEGSRLRERALARAREQAAGRGGGQGTEADETAAALLATVAPATLKRNFSEHFIDTLTPRQVARFALAHGAVLARAPSDGPVREVPADPAASAGRRPERRQRVPAQVYLMTAVVETDTRKSRVLLGHGTAVLGQRIHSGPRLGALAALAAGVVGTPLWLMQAQSAAVPPGAAATTAQTQEPAAVSAPALAPAPAAAPTAASASAVAAAAPAAAPPPAAETPPAVPIIEPAVAPPADAESTTGRRALSIVPRLSDAQKALAREQRAALMEAAAAAAAAASPRAAPAAAPAASAPALARAPLPALPSGPTHASTTPTPATAAPPSGPVFAISTRALRTRAEADQVRVAMQSLLQTPGRAPVQVDVLPQGDDWRVVALPFAQRADAEKGRALLASRGMRVAVVDF